MGRIPASYLLNRLITFALTVFIAATLIWIIPRLSPVDPVDVMLGRMAAGGRIHRELGRDPGATACELRSR
jgi:peptide/nickel transport system permease protein